MVAAGCSSESAPTRSSELGAVAVGVAEPWYFATTARDPRLGGGGAQLRYAANTSKVIAESLPSSASCAARPEPQEPSVVDTALTSSTIAIAAQVSAAVCHHQPEVGEQEGEVTKEESSSGDGALHPCHVAMRISACRRSRRAKSAGAESRGRRVPPSRPRCAPRTAAPRSCAAGRSRRGHARQPSAAITPPTVRPDPEGIARSMSHRGNRREDPMSAANEPRHQQQAQSRPPARSRNAGCPSHSARAARALVEGEGEGRGARRPSRPPATRPRCSRRDTREHAVAAARLRQQRDQPVPAASGRSAAARRRLTRRRSATRASIGVAACFTTWLRITRRLRIPPPSASSSTASRLLGSAGTGSEPLLPRGIRESDRILSASMRHAATRVAHFRERPGSPIRPPPSRRRPASRSGRRDARRAPRGTRVRPRAPARAPRSRRRRAPWTAGGHNQQ